MDEFISCSDGSVTPETLREYAAWAVANLPHPGDTATYGADEIADGLFDELRDAFQGDRADEMWPRGDTRLWLTYVRGGVVTWWSDPVSDWLDWYPDRDTAAADWTLTWRIYSGEIQGPK